MVVGGRHSSGVNGEEEETIGMGNLSRSQMREGQGDIPLRNVLYQVTSDTLYSGLWGRSQTPPFPTCKEKHTAAN